MSVDKGVLAGVGIVVLVGIGVITRRYPRLGVLAWLLTIAFVPVWLGINYKVYVMPATVVALVVLLFAAHRLGTLRLGIADFLIFGFMISCLVPMVTGGATRTTVFVALTNWLLPFVLGRLMPRLVGVRWLYGAVAVIFCVVAVGLVLEFLGGWNPFISYLHQSNDLFSTWGTEQTRGGRARAEGAFGHSIAAGSAMAMAMALTMGSRFRPWLRIAMVLVMGAGVVVTLSRGSMLGAALGIAMVVLLLRDVPVRVRIGMIVTFGILGASLIPFVVEVLHAAGSEASNSASYRTWLLALVPGIALLGYSPLASRTSDGQLYFGGFRSIDSQLIYTGLQYGWIPLVLGLTALLAALLVVVRRRGSVATIAVVAQIPALLTVALITQYADFFWFVAGLAAFSQMPEPEPHPDPGREPAAMTNVTTLTQAVRDLSSRPDQLTGPVA